MFFVGLGVAKDDRMGLRSEAGGATVHVGLVRLFFQLLAKRG
jgi:hypothetical protein